MQASEKRFPRDAFTKKLRRLCERLDDSCRRAVTYRDFRARPQSRDVEITALWVVGSYARGALDCGDLDIVLELHPDSRDPGTNALSRTFFGSLPYVRYYVGDPGKNTSGVPFSEAIKIWSGPRSDWAASIDSIKLDPGAGRAERATDVIPLRLEQLSANSDDLDELVKQYDERLVEWTFIPFDDLLTRPLAEAETLERDEALLRHAERWGKKSQHLVPAISRLMSTAEPDGLWDSSRHWHATLKCGSSHLFLGKPSVVTRYLTGHADVRQLVLMPHISARGPNGAWIIRRGPQHPDVIAMADRYAFYPWDGTGPAVVYFIGVDRSWHDGTRVLSLFSTREAADEAEADLAEDIDDPDLLPLETTCSAGAALIDVVTRCDALEVDGELIALNHEGTHHTGDSLITDIQGLAAMLPRNQHATL